MNNNIYKVIAENIISAPKIIQGKTQIGNFSVFIQMRRVPDITQSIVRYFFYSDIVVMNNISIVIEKKGSLPCAAIYRKHGDDQKKRKKDMANP